MITTFIVNVQDNLIQFITNYSQFDSTKWINNLAIYLKLFLLKTLLPIFLELNSFLFVILYFGYLFSVFYYWLVLFCFVLCPNEDSVFNLFHPLVLLVLRHYLASFLCHHKVWDLLLIVLRGSMWFSNQLLKQKSDGIELPLERNWKCPCSTDFKL